MAGPIALLAAGLAGSAYLSARFSLEQDLLFFRILAAATFRLLRAERADQLNIFYILEQHAQHKTTASRPFLLFEGKSYTYRETYQIVLKYGAWLRARHGVKEKDIVAVNFQNSDVFIFLWLGLWAIGAKPAFINYNLAGAPLTHSLRVSTAKLALVDPRMADALTDQVRRDLPGVQFVVMTEEVDAEARKTDPVREPNPVRSESGRLNMALLIYTSGTTGLPKPALVSWGKVYGGTAMAAKGTGLKPADVLYTCMPLYHASAAMLGVCNVLFTGAALAIGRKFSTKTFWKDVRESNATVIQYVGETCRYLAFAPPEVDQVTGENLDKKHRVRLAVGNGLRPDVWNRFKERFGIETIFEFYAATEGAGAAWNLSRNDFSAGAIGQFGALSRAISGGYRTAVVRLDYETELPWRDSKTGLCQRVKTGEAGEFLIRLPDDDIREKFQGYYGDSAATNAKVLRNVFRNGDAWFRSGDVLRWDSNGLLFFADRIGDTFRWKSENVSTAEVAQVLGMHPAVHEANVYGVELPHHDGRAGCVAIAFNSSHPTSELMASLANHVQKTLPRYAAPLFLRVVKGMALQNTGTNKLQKNILQQQGVDPAKVEGDLLFWLRDGAYVPFTGSDWTKLQQGGVKL